MTVRAALPGSVLWLAMLAMPLAARAELSVAHERGVMWLQGGARALAASGDAARTPSTRRAALSVVAAARQVAATRNGSAGERGRSSGIDGMADTDGFGASADTGRETEAAGAVPFVGYPGRSIAQPLGLASLARPGIPGGEAAVIPYVRQAASDYRLDPALLLAVIHTESGFNPQAVSPKGAVGLMQLMPATWRRYGIADARDPRQNVQAGAAHLQYLLGRYGDLQLALAAYNAGEGAVERHGMRIPPYAETQDYVPRVISLYRGYQASAAPNAGGDAPANDTRQRQP